MPETESTISDGSEDAEVESDIMQVCILNHNRGYQIV